MRQRNLESGFVQSDVAYWAYTGTGTFSGGPPITELRSIASLYPESIHIVTRNKAGIDSVRDLIGKRVSLDEPGSGTLIDAQLVLNEYGISRQDIEVEYLKPDVAVKRIKANKLDAFFFVAGYPARAVSELAADTDIKLLPIDGPEADRLVASHRFFAREAIPAGVYEGIGGRGNRLRHYQDALEREFAKAARQRPCQGQAHYPANRAAGHRGAAASRCQTLLQGARHRAEVIRYELIFGNSRLRGI
jgi:TRAP-type uncharacterized transport system substrate-binding protein